MTSMCFSDVAYTQKKKTTRKARFLSEMNDVLPWDCLLQPILQKYPKLIPRPETTPGHLRTNPSRTDSEAQRAKNTPRNRAFVTERKLTNLLKLDLIRASCTLEFADLRESS